MPIATRLTNTGTLIVNGSFDETSLAAGAVSFNGTNQYLSVPSNAGFAFGTGDFTVEFWINYSAHNAYGGMVCSAGGGAGWTGWNIIFLNTADNVYVEFNSNAATIVSSSTLPKNVWNHVALVRSGSSIVLYINGVNSGSTTYSTNIDPGAAPLVVAVERGFSAFTTGYISNVRVVKGTAVYTANFIPPEAILSSITNTQLLLNVTDSSNFIKDNSPNKFTVTNNGTATWIANGPFNRGSTTIKNRLVNPTSVSGTTVEVSNIFDEFTGAPVVDSSLTQWLDFGQTSSYSGSGTTVTDLSPTATASVTLTGSPTFNNIDGGGSEAFNGSTQYGTGSGTPLGLSAYTKSFWFKLTSYIPANNVVSSAVGGHFCYFSGGNKLISGHAFWSNFNVFPSVTSFALNTWYHACVTFNTATGMALYVNGVLDSTYVSTSGTSPTNTPVTGTGQVDIANYGTGNLLAGSIGQVMVYNRVLTAAEIVQNYNALRNRYALPAVTATQMPVVQRQLSSGTLLVNSGGFDEFTGIASVVEGLVAYYDPAYSSSYSGAGASLYNLVDGVAATLNGTYSAGTAAVGTSVSGTQTIRLTNSDLVTAVNNISHIQAPSFTNITTVSIWFYQHTYNDIARYILDGRTGGSEGWIYNGSLGSNWSTGIVYVNGGASSGTPSWLNWGGTATGVWKNVTFIASTPFTDDINIFSRWSDNEGLDVTFGPILIYNRVLTQAENLQNFNALRNRYGI